MWLARTNGQLTGKVIIPLSYFPLKDRVSYYKTRLEEKNMSHSSACHCYSDFTRRYRCRLISQSFYQRTSRPFSKKVNWKVPRGPYRYISKRLLHKLKDDLET